MIALRERSPLETHQAKKILYVDDVAVIRVLAKLALESGGDFVVALCSSGEEAIAKAVAFAPDIILLDVMMPGMDGPATLQSLRQLPETALKPVVFMTGDVRTEDIERYRQLGVVDVIAKPFDPITLAARVNEIWQRRGQQPSMESSSAEASLLAELAELQLGYLQGLSEKLAGLKEAIDRYENERKPEALREAGFIAHSLAGSAGTFGFHLIGNSAKNLQEILIPWISGDLSPDAEDVETIKKNYEAIEKEIFVAHRASKGSE